MANPSNDTRSATLPVQQWNYILEVLSRCPYAEVSATIQNLTVQFRQQEPADEPPLAAMPAPPAPQSEPEVVEAPDPVIRKEPLPEAD